MIFFLNHIHAGLFVSFQCITSSIIGGCHQPLLQASQNTLGNSFTTLLLNKFKIAFMMNQVSEVVTIRKLQQQNYV